MKTGIDFAIIASNLTEAENHTRKANEAEADKKSNWTLHNPKRAGIASNRAQACGSPENGKENSEAPEEKRTRIPTKNRRLNGLRGEGLGLPGMEPSGIAVCSLLIEDGCYHDVRGTALVTLIRVQLRYGCHAIVPELATACDTGLFDEILARILEIVPTLRKTETPPWMVRSLEPTDSIEHRPLPILVLPTHLTEFRFPLILSFDTDAPRAAGSRRENL